MPSPVRVSERFRCKTKDCPWSKDEEMHVPWCLHIEGVEHRRDQPWHQHWPKRSQGGKEIVAVLCSYCSDRVDNTPDWDNTVSPGEDGELEYILWDTQVEGGWNSPLIRHVLGADSAAAEAKGRGSNLAVTGSDSQRTATLSATLPPSPAAAPSASGIEEPSAGPRHEPLPELLEPDTKSIGEGDVNASGESGAAEAQDLGRVTPITPGLLNVQDTEPALASPPSLEAWCHEGMELVYMGLAFRDATDGLRFAIGDWMNNGEGMLGEEVYGYLRGFQDVTVRQYSWVAGRVAQNTRVSKLDWSCHRAVAALPPGEQEKWLKTAQEENLNSKGLYRAIHGKKTILTLPPELQERRYTYAELDFLCGTCRAAVAAMEGR